MIANNTHVTAHAADLARAETTTAERIRAASNAARAARTVTVTADTTARPFLRPLLCAAAALLVLAPAPAANAAAAWSNGTAHDIGTNTTVTVSGGTSIISATSGTDNANILYSPVDNAVLTVYGGTTDVLSLRGPYTLSSSFTGQITVASGILELLNVGSSSYTKTITANNTGTLRFGSNLDLRYSAIALADSGRLVLADTTGTSQIGVLSGTTGTEILLGANTLYVNNGTTATTFAGKISGAGGNLTVYGGDGSLILSGVNTYTGTTTIDSGTLSLSGSGSIAASTTLILETGAKFDITNAVTSGQSVKIHNLALGTGDLAGEANKSSIILGANTLEITGTGATGANITSNDGGSLIISGGGTLTLSGTLSHNGSTYVRGSGTVLEFDGASLTNGSALRLETGAKFKPTADAWTTVPALYGTAGTEVILRGGTFQIWNGGDFAGVIKDELSQKPTAFNFGSNGTLTLSGVNTYTGTTMLSGTLALKGSGSIANSEYLFLHAHGVLDISTASGPVSVKSLRSRLMANDEDGRGDYDDSPGVGVVLGSNTLTVIPSATSDTFYGIISGINGGLTVSNGLSPFLLGGVNTYTGETTVSGTSILSLKANTLTGFNGSIALSSGVTLNNTAKFRIYDIPDTDTVTINNLNGASGTEVQLGNTTLDVQGTGTFAGTFSTWWTQATLIKSGEGTLEITGTSTGFMGTTNVKGTGVVKLSGAGALIGSMDGGTDPVSRILSAGSVRLENSGTFDISGVTTTPNALDLLVTANITQHIGVTDQGTIIRELNGTSGTKVLLGTKTLVLISGGTFGGVISGIGGGIYLNNYDSPLTLTNVNTYTGPTALVFGLTLSGSGSIATSSAVELKGGTLDLSEITSSTTIQNLSSWNAGAKIVLGDEKTLVVNTTSGYPFIGVISGEGGNLTKTGPAAFQLQNVNTYTGLTTVSGTGSQLILDAAGNISASSGVKLEAGGIFSISSIDAAGTTIKNLEGMTGTTVSLGGKNLEINGTASGTFAGAINDTGNLTKSGSGTLTLSGWNSYTGSTTVSGSAILALEGYSSRLRDSSGVMLNDTATFDISQIGNADNGIIKGLNGTVNTRVLLGSQTLTVNGGGNYAGVISGNGSLIKGGAVGDTLTLTNANTYAGATTVNAGTLVVSGSGTLGPSANYAGVITVAGGANLTFNSSAAQTLSGTSTATTGTITHNSSGLLTVASGGAVTAATFAVAANRTLRVLGTVGASGSTATTFAAGSRLEGTGTVFKPAFNGTSGAANLVTIAPGITATAGQHLTFNSSSAVVFTNVAFELNINEAPDYVDYVYVNGTATFGTGNIINLLGSSLPAATSVGLGWNYPIIETTDGFTSKTLSGYTININGSPTNDYILAFGTTTGGGSPKFLYLRPAWDILHWDISENNPAVGPGANVWTIVGTDRFWRLHEDIIGLSDRNDLNVSFANGDVVIFNTNQPKAPGVIAPKVVVRTDGVTAYAMVVTGSGSDFEFSGGPITISATATGSDAAAYFAGNYTNSLLVSDGAHPVFNNTNVTTTLLKVESAAIVELGNTGSFAGVTEINLVSGTGLIFNRDTDSDYTHGGLITGAGTVTKAGTGTVTLTGLNTYTGNTIITGGTLVANALSSSVANGGAATPNTGSAVTLGNDGIIQFSSGGTPTALHKLQFSDTGLLKQRIEVDASVYATLAGPATGALTVNSSVGSNPAVNVATGGRLNLAGNITFSGNTAAGAIRFANTGTLNFDSAGDVLFTGNKPATSGGAIQGVAGDLSLTGNVASLAFTGNGTTGTATTGGAIHTAGDLSINLSSPTGVLAFGGPGGSDGNTAAGDNTYNNPSGRGGAIYAATSLSLSGTYLGLLVQGNSGKEGGAFSSTGAISITGNYGANGIKIAGNHATLTSGSYGGAFHTSTGGIMFNTTTTGMLTIGGATDVDRNYTVGTTGLGGAFYAFGAISINGSYKGLLISQNTSGQHGGALYGAPISIVGDYVTSGIEISNNTAGTAISASGGAFYSTGNITIAPTDASNITISGNSARESGGAFIASGSVGSITITGKGGNLTVSNNLDAPVSGGWGGAFYAANGITLDGAYGSGGITISGNSLTGTGGFGGAFATAASSITIAPTSNSPITFSNNKATGAAGKGGAIYLGGGATFNLTLLTGTTFTATGNSAAGEIGSGENASGGFLYLAADNSSANFALNGTATATIGSYTDATNNAAYNRTDSIAGAGAVVKTQTGTLTLYGDNRYTGNTTVDGGLLLVAGAGSLGNGATAANYAGAVNVGASGTLTFNTATPQTLSGSTSGASYIGYGTINHTGTGRLTVMTGATVAPATFAVSNNGSTVVTLEVLGTVGAVGNAATTSTTFAENTRLEGTGTVFKPVFNGTDASAAATAVTIAPGAHSTAVAGQHLTFDSSSAVVFSNVAFELNIMNAGTFVDYVAVTGQATFGSGNVINLLGTPPAATPGDMGWNYPIIETTGGFTGTTLAGYTIKLAGSPTSNYILAFGNGNGGSNPDWLYLRPYEAPASDPFARVLHWDIGPDTTYDWTNQADASTAYWRLHANTDLSVRTSNVSFVDGDMVIFNKNVPDKPSYIAKNVVVRSGGVSVFGMVIEGAGSEFHFSGGSITTNAGATHADDFTTAGFTSSILVDSGAKAYFENVVTTPLLTVQNGATAQLEPSGYWIIDEINTGTVAGAGTGTVVFNKADDDMGNPNNSLNGKITGEGHVVKIGDGSMWLNGDNTYTGNTTVQAGTLLVGSGSASGGGLGTRYENTGTPTEITSRNYAGKITIDSGATLGFHGPDRVVAVTPGTERTQELSGLIIGEAGSTLLVTDDRRVEISGSADNTPTANPTPGNYNHFEGNLEIVEGGYLNVSGRLDVKEEAFDQGTPFAATYSQHVYTGDMIVNGGATSSVKGGTLEFSYNRDWTLTTGTLTGTPGDTNRGNFVVSTGQNFYFMGDASGYAGHTEVKGTGTAFHLPSGGTNGAVWGLAGNAGNFLVQSGNALWGGGVKATDGTSFATTLNVGVLAMAPGSTLNVLPGGFKVNVAEAGLPGSVLISNNIRITIEAATATAAGTFPRNLTNTEPVGAPGATKGAALTFANAGGVVFSPGSGVVLPAQVNLQIGGSILVNGSNLYEYVLIDGLHTQSIVSAANVGGNADAAIAQIFGNSGKIQVMGAQFQLAFSGTRLIMTQTSLSSTVPEPSTYGLCGGLGVLAFALWRRRQGKK